MKQKAVTATGLKGFMQWFQGDQPAIYQATATKIAKAVPKGFSGFNGAVAQNMRLAQGVRSMRLRGYSGLGCCGVCLASVGSCAEMIAPNVCIETSCAANSGATCSAALSAVGTIIGSAASQLLNQSCQASYSCLVTGQLQRAANGLPPTGATSSSVGVATAASPPVSTSGLLLLLAGGGILLWALAGRRA